MFRLFLLLAWFLFPLVSVNAQTFTKGPTGTAGVKRTGDWLSVGVFYDLNGTLTQLSFDYDYSAYPYGAGPGGGSFGSAYSKSYVGYGPVIVTTVFRLSKTAVPNSFYGIMPLDSKTGRIAFSPTNDKVWMMQAEVYYDGNPNYKWRNASYTLLFDPDASTLNPLFIPLLPTPKDILDNAKADMEAKAEALTKTVAGSPNEAAAKAAYEAAKAAYDAANSTHGSASSVAQSSTAAATAKNQSAALSTVAASQVAGSTGQAAAVSGQATVAAIDALRAESNVNSQKIVDAIKANSTSGGSGSSSTGTNMAGVEGRIDTTNNNLEEVRDAVKKGNALVQSGNPSDLANGAVTSSASVGTETSTKLQKFTGTASGLQPVQPSGNAPGINHGTPVPKIRIGSKEYDFDPANFIIDNGYLPLAYACRTTIAVLLLVAFYKYILGVMTTLLAGLFTSDGVSTSLTVRAGWSLVVDASGEMSPARPIITIARTALFLTFLGGVVALIDTMCAYFLYGAPSIIQLPSVMTTNYTNLISLGGRGFYFINLFVPVLTVIYMPLHAAMAHAAVMAMYAVAKSQSAAAQSV